MKNYFPKGNYFNTIQNFIKAITVQTLFLKFET